MEKQIIEEVVSYIMNTPTGSFNAGYAVELSRKLKRLEIYKKPRKRRNIERGQKMCDSETRRYFEEQKEKMQEIKQTLEDIRVSQGTVKETLAKSNSMVKTNTKDINNLATKQRNCQDKNEKKIYSLIKETVEQKASDKMTEKLIKQLEQREEKLDSEIRKLIYTVLGSSFGLIITIIGIFIKISIGG